MSDTTATFTAKILAEHGTFVNALAQSLLRDEHAAEDLAQKTWLATLEHPPREVRSVRSWLARVMRNLVHQRHRDDQRRLRREQLAAPREAVPGTEHHVERDQVLRSVIEAVLALEEPYKSTVMMRYFEGLPPRAIAERRNQPAATVRSQLQRALAELRLNLDAQHGGQRTRWTHGLALIAGINLAKVGPTVSLAKVGLAASVIVATTFTVATILTRPKPVVNTVASATPAAPLPAPAPARAELAALAPASAQDPSLAVVFGHVQDESGRPIAGATVRIPDDPAPASVTSDQDGSYRLEFARREWVSILAEADGFAQSLVYDLALQDGEDHNFDFTLAIGGSLEGHVLDAAGQPVEHATVAIGPRFRLTVTDAAGRDGYRTQIHRSTDGQGYFRADGLSEGQIDLLTSAFGHPAAVGGALIRRGETTSITIQLGSGATVHGVVRLADGSPVAGARVRAAPIDAGLAVSSVTDVQGQFEIRGAPTGRITLTAKSPDQTLQAREVVELVTGGDRRWEPVLSRGLELKGRVVDHDGNPLEHLWVEVQLAEVSRNHESRITDREGRFAVTNWHDVPTTIIVQAMEGDQITSPPLAWVRDARPGSTEMLIRVTKDARNFARVTGRVLSSTKEPVAGIRVDCYPMELDQYHDRRSETDALGAFAVGPLAPARYAIEAVNEHWSRNQIGVFDLKPGQELDLGDIVLPERGRLVATVHEDQLPPADRLALGVMGIRPTTLWWGVDPKNGIPDEALLPPGEYMVTVFRRLYELDDHAMAVAQHFIIKPGEDTLVEVPAKTLLSHTLRFVEGDTPEPMRVVHYTLRDEPGRVIVQNMVLKGLDVAHFDLELRIDPGRYRLSASSDTHRRTEATLDLRAPTNAPLEIVLD